MPPIYTDTANGVTETIAYDAAEHQVVVRRSEDVTPIMDAVAKANANGVSDMPGMRLVMEVPITLAMQFCDDRGIPWERFLYGNEYDDEFQRFAAEHQRLTYQHAKKYH